VLSRVAFATRRRIVQPLTCLCLRSSVPLCFALMPRILAAVACHTRVSELIQAMRSGYRCALRFAARPYHARLRHAQSTSSTHSLRRSIQRDPAAGASRLGVHQRLAVPESGEPSRAVADTAGGRAALRRAYGRLDSASGTEHRFQAVCIKNAEPAAVAASSAFDPSVRSSRESFSA
jgi:hypothetical protein